MREVQGISEGDGIFGCNCLQPTGYEPFFF